MGWQEGRGKGRAEEGQARSVFSVGGMRGYPWEYERGVLRQTMGPYIPVPPGPRMCLHLLHASCLALRSSRQCLHNFPVSSLVTLPLLMTQTWLGSAQWEMENTQPIPPPLAHLGSLFGLKHRDFGMPKSRERWIKQPISVCLLRKKLRQLGQQEVFAEFAQHGLFSRVDDVESSASS
jgi:hypothetical protein